jgi:phage host-nuclease inhibitor protein Gam
MARRKPPAPALLSWDDVDDAMRQIIEKDNELNGLTALLDEAIEKLKHDYEKAAKPLQDDVKVMGSQIKQFVSEHRDDLGAKKTMKLLHGKTGFRLSTSCVVPRGKEQNVVAQLEAMGLWDCVAVKKTVNKEQLKGQPEDVIIQAGARLDTKDTFWYEVEHADLEAPY